MKKPHCVVLTHQLIRTVAKPVPKGETATVRLRVLAVRAIIGSVRNASLGAVGCPPRAAPAAGRLVGAGRAPAVARRRCRMRRERAGCRGRRTVCGERWRCVRKSAGSSSPDGRTGLSRSGFGCRDNRRSGLRQLDPDGGGIRCERAIPSVLTRNTPAPRLGRGAGAFRALNGSYGAADFRDGAAGRIFRRMEATRDLSALRARRRARPLRRLAIGICPCRWRGSVHVVRISRSRRRPASR